MQNKVVSSLFGEVSYGTEEVYHFEHGVPGFPEEKSFIFINVTDSPFTVMHSVMQDLYFFLIDPFSIFSDYKYKLPDFVIEQLDIKSQEEVLSYTVVVLREPLEDSTTNLIAPIVVNTRLRKGVQLVLEGTNYSVRQPILSSDNKGKVAIEG